MYKQFIIYTLSDMAERRTQSGIVLKRGERRRELIAGLSRRVFIAGNDVCYQGRETLRGSDASLRLTLAVTAAELLERDAGKGRGANWTACLYVANALMASPCQRLRERFHQVRVAKQDREELKMRPNTNVAGRDPRFQELDALIDADKASRSAPLRKLAAVVRNDVGRFRRRNPDWRQKFEIHLGWFRSTHREPDWYGEQIAYWDKWLADFERRTEPFEWWGAMPLAHLAQLTHEHGAFKRAAGYYRKAISAAERAVITIAFLSAYACGVKDSIGEDEFRITLIRYFERQIDACEKRLGPEVFIFRLPGAGPSANAG